MRVVGDVNAPWGALAAHDDRADGTDRHTVGSVVTVRECCAGHEGLITKESEGGNQLLCGGISWKDTVHTTAPAYRGASSSRNPRRANV